MKDEMREKLRGEFRDCEARLDYADMHLDSSIALQIKALRLQRKWTQEELAKKAGMHQSQVSEMEQVTHSSWTLKSLKPLARAFDLRLHVSFESFGSLLDEYVNQSRTGWERHSFADDPAFKLDEAAAEVRPITDNPPPQRAAGPPPGEVVRLADWRERNRRVGLYETGEGRALG